MTVFRYFIGLVTYSNKKWGLKCDDLDLDLTASIVYIYALRVNLKLKSICYLLKYHIHANKWYLDFNCNLPIEYKKHRLD